MPSRVLAPFPADLLTVDIEQHPVTPLRACKVLEPDLTISLNPPVECDL
ncbi:hypothetical protein [Paenibacillus sp. PDC88]|nr:hypothetical protein [Paenibacillus sp. PDC88]